MTNAIEEIAKEPKSFEGECNNCLAKCGEDFIHVMNVPLSIF